MKIFAVAKFLSLGLIQTPVQTACQRIEDCPANISRILRVCFNKIMQKMTLSYRENVNDGERCAVIGGTLAFIVVPCLQTSNERKIVQIVENI
jgi:hypothetical protein